MDPIQIPTISRSALHCTALHLTTPHHCKLIKFQQLFSPFAISIWGGVLYGGNSTCVKIIKELCLCLTDPHYSLLIEKVFSCSTLGVIIFICSHYLNKIHTIFNKKIKLNNLGNTFSAFKKVDVILPKSCQDRVNNFLNGHCRQLNWSHPASQPFLVFKLFTVQRREVRAFSSTSWAWWIQDNIAQVGLGNTVKQLFMLQ